MQPSLFAVTQWTVTQLTNHIRDRLETDVELQDLWVQGEISNLSRPGSGHVYFTLKDAGASLRCVVWKSTVSRLGTPLQEGQAVVLHGKIGVYEAQGSYQLYVDQARPAGES
jgi:exodeoxyribonuclease VII large subunit